jgi:hypothetical protein
MNTRNVMNVGLQSLVILVAAVSFAQDEQNWEAVVLKATSIQDANGGILMTLVSGQQIQIDKADRSESWSTGVNDAIEQARAKESAAAGSAPPSDDAARPGIRAACSEKWGSDYKMQKYCQDKQFDALSVLRRRDMRGGTLSEVRANCADKWGTDYKMRDYCEKKQVEALRELNR